MGTQSKQSRMPPTGEKRSFCISWREFKKSCFLTGSFVWRRGSSLLIIDTSPRLTHSSLLLLIYEILALLVSSRATSPLISLLQCGWETNLLGVPLIHLLCMSFRFLLFLIQQVFVEALLCSWVCSSEHSLLFSSSQSSFCFWDPFYFFHLCRFI